MTENVIVNPEVLQALNQRFQCRAAAHHRSLSTIRSEMNSLRSRGVDGWIGDAANQHFIEMEQYVIPGYERLIESLNEAVKVMLYTQSEFETADREGGRYFQQMADQNSLDASGSTSSVAQNPSSSRYRRWGKEHTVTVNGVSIKVYGNKVSPRHLKIIEDTLSVMPSEHVQLIPRIRVQEHITGKGGKKITQGGGSGTIANPHIPLEQQRLNLTLGALNNEGKNFSVRGHTQKAHLTILHEAGHVVDKRLGIVRDAPEATKGAYESWFNRTHPNYRGHTKGPGEWAAEAYSRYIRTGDPAIVGSSSAFRSVNGSH